MPGHSLIDIANGAADVNQNGIPDSCESGILIASPYCFCVAPLAPCGNNDATAGCENSTTQGALLTASGSSGVSPDDLVLTVSNLPTFQFGIVYMGTVQVGPPPFGDGLRCAGGNVVRLQVAPADASGNATSSVSLSSGLVAGDVKRFQYWCRIPGCSPCGSSFTLSNGYEITFTP